MKKWFSKISLNEVFYHTNYEVIKRNIWGGGKYLEFKTAMKIYCASNGNTQIIKYHNIDAPAIVINQVIYSNIFTRMFNICKTKKKIAEIFLDNGTVHNLYGPAIILHDYSAFDMNDCYRLLNYFSYEQVNDLNNWYVVKTHSFTKNVWVIDGTINVNMEDWAKSFGIDLENLTDEDKTLIRMKWS